MHVFNKVIAGAIVLLASVSSVSSIAGERPTPVESIFEFHFPQEFQAEGLSLAKAIGADMPPLPGFLHYHVVQDVADPGHLEVTTRWDSNASAQAVLKFYGNDPKVLRAKELQNGAHSGFVGEILPRH